MTAYVEADPRWSCYRKKRFRSEDIAIKTANRRNYENGDEHRRLVVYACHHCAGYHLGNVPR